MTPDLFEQDLAVIPARLRDLGGALDAADPWHETVSRSPLVSGMGSSAYAGRTTAGWLRARGAYVIDELATTDPGWPGGEGTTAVLVSASGSSAETLDRSRRLRAGTQRIALVNRTDSPLAKVSDVIIDMMAGDESGGVACRTYRHTLALLLAFAENRSVVGRACQRAANVTQSLLADQSWLEAVDRVLSPVDTTYWIAPENRIGSALQSALMAREIPRRAAVGCETGDWSHVDVYLTLTTDYRCVVFTGSPWDEQAADWMRKRGTRVVSVGTPLDVPGEVHVPLAEEPFVRMLVEPLIAELLALRWWRRNPVEVP